MKIFKRVRKILLDENRIEDFLILTNPISYVLALLYSLTYLIGLLTLFIYKHSRLELFYFYLYGIHKKGERWIREYLVWTKKVNAGNALDKWLQSKIDKKAQGIIDSFEKNYE